MDYEQKYKEALEIAKEIYNRSDATEGGKIILESMFPELKESEDERIRKELIRFFSKGAEYDSSTNGIKDRNIIAWLEKQGEQKHIDNVEPKFKIEKDKWYICIRDLDDNYCTRAFSKGGTYHSTKDETLTPDNSNIPFEIKYCVNDYFRLWTIQDAKDGDVLSSGNPFIFRGFGDKRHPNSPTAYCGINSSGTFNLSWENDWWTANDVHPATKEQCDLLFSKMKEAGYEWDAEKKELKKIEQSHAWCEEDEKILKRIDNLLYSQCQIHGSEYEEIHNWLKSLKSRQNQYDKGYNDGYSAAKYNHWKPSEEQMQELETAIICRTMPWEQLGTLYNDLKKL